MTPRVSIGMPVRNGAVHIAEALDALLAQTMGDFELLISDNASTDATADIIADYAQRDSRIRYERQPADIGAIANFNVVLARASAPAFMWAAHDDKWSLGCVEALVAALAAQPDAVLAYPAVTYCDVAMKPQITYDALPSIAAMLWHDQIAEMATWPGIQGKANLIYGLMRREVLIRAGGFHIWSAGTFGLDVLVVLRLATLGPFAHAADAAFYKRASNGSRDGEGMDAFLAGRDSILAVSGAAA